MNKTDLLAQERFDGDLRKTIDYILHNFDKEKLNEYVYDFNKEQAVIFIDIYTKEAVSLMTPEEINELVVGDYEQSCIGMSEDEIVSALVNPFGQRIKKRLGLLAAAILGPYAVALLLPDNVFSTTSATFFVGIFTAIIAITMARDILNYFKFRKLKKKYTNRQNAS